MDVVSVGVLTYFLATVAAVLWPYVNAYLGTGEAFDPKKALAKVLGALGLAAVLVVVPEFAKGLETLATQYDYMYLYVLAVAVMAFGGAGFGQNIAKSIMAVRNR